MTKTALGHPSILSSESLRVTMHGRRLRPGHEVSVRSGPTDEGRFHSSKPVAGTGPPGRPGSAGPTAGGPAEPTAPPGPAPARRADRGARGRLRRDPTDVPGGVPQFPAVRWTE